MPLLHSLRSLADWRRDRKKLLALAIRAAHQAAKDKNLQQLGATLAVLQLLMARRAQQAMEDMLDEQAIDAATGTASLIANSLSGISMLGIPLQDRIEFAAEYSGNQESNLTRMALTEMSDTARVATGVELATRPTLTGYIRYLNPPSCARCAILAGRVYRWSEVFDRHDNCDCDMIAVENRDDMPDDAITDPMDAFNQGLIYDLSKADTQAIEDGADIGRIVNVRKQAAGLRSAGRVVQRNGKMMPEAIYQLASDRAEAIELLLKFGFIR